MLSIEDHEALAAFAREFGRTWRRELCRRWENGTLLLSQVSVSEAELAVLVRLKGKLRPSGLRSYRPPAYVVETRVDGLPWVPASLPNERAPHHETPGEAVLRIEHLLTLDDPTWRRAEYRIIESTGLARKPGPTRCFCGRPVMLAHTVEGRGRMALDPAPAEQAHGVFVFFMGTAIPDPLAANLPEGATLYREHACSRPNEGARA
jgi:hypothetical protein